MSTYFENEEKIKNIERQLPDFEIYENMLDDYSIFIDNPIIPICIYHYNGSSNNVYSKYISKVVIPSVEVVFVAEVLAVLPLQVELVAPEPTAFPLLVVTLVKSVLTADNTLIRVPAVGALLAVKAVPV